MFNLRSLFAFWVVAVLFFGSVGRAHAQTTGGGVTVTIPTAGVKRDHQDYSGKVLVTQINYKDCLNEDFFTFTVNLGTGFSNYALEVWAGTSCDMTSARPPSGTATCWRVADPIVPSNIIINNLQVPVRTLLSGRTGGSNVGGGNAGSGGSDSTGTGGGDSTGSSGSDGTGVGGSGGTDSGSAGSSNTNDGPPECNPTSAAVAPQTLTLYFLLLDSNAMVGGQATYKVTYKLNAPAPPTNVTSGTGENIAPVSWTPIPNNPDQTIDGYQLYCDPAPGKEGLAESDVEWDPNILPVSCPKSDILKAGTRPADKYKCGTAAKTSSHANATNLVNMVPYNVAVAATDTYRNVGEISAPACAIPQPVTGFFEAYRDAGGEGGGGFCSFSRHGRPVLLFSLLGLGFCLILRRRSVT